MKKCFTLLLVCALLLGGCAPAPASENSVVGFYFDTVVMLSGYCEERVLKDALESCAGYERLFSKNIEGSDVWRINHANGQAVQVGAETLGLLKLALEISEASGGAFDVSIGRAAALWDFMAESPVLPDPAALADAAASADYRRIRIENDSVSIPADMQLDLGGIAKGYISARIAEQLRAAGVKSALLDFGGNMVAIGTKPGDFPWSIGIEDPDAPHQNILLRFGCVDGAVVTSGDYERCFMLDGVRYHHILDVHSGMPVHNGVRQFTVISADAAKADALSTACFALGAEKGLALCERYGAQGICVLEDGSIRTSEAFHENGVVMFNVRP